MGFLERPERIVLLIIGSFYYMEPVLWVLAPLSNWTVVHRILYTRSQIATENSREEKPVRENEEIPSTGHPRTQP